MTQVYRTLRVAPGDEGVLGVVIDAPPMNLIGPELVRDLVSLIGPGPHGRPVRPGAAYPRPARAQPRRPPRSAVTQKTDPTRETRHARPK